jgi:hypothetical protein
MAPRAGKSERNCDRQELRPLLTELHSVKTREVGEREELRLSTVTAWREAAGRTAQRWFESPAGSSRLLPMEGLRGLAVLLVFFVHLHAFFGHYLASHQRFYSVSVYFGLIGNAGVDLFFVLSGFIFMAPWFTVRFPISPSYDAESGASTLHFL